MNKKYILITAAAVLLIAAAILLVFLLTSPKEAAEPQPAPDAVPAETAAPAPTTAPVPTAASPSELPDAPSITPPAERSEDAASGSDIYLRPVAPSSGSDVIVTLPASDSDLG